MVPLHPCRGIFVPVRRDISVLWESPAVRVCFPCDLKTERNDMKEIHGTYTSANIFTDYIDQYALAQVQMICDHECAEGNRIRVMPDVHPGKVGPIGLTHDVSEPDAPGSRWH